MILHVEVWSIMVKDEGNGIIMMITWHHSMVMMDDYAIHHGINGVKVWNHGMTWHEDGTKRGKKWHFRGQKWAKRGWRGGWQNYTEKSVS